MKYISRHMENRVLELSRSYSAILLTGPRQAGKTTMLRELAEKENIGRRYVTLDDLNERDMAKNDPALFLHPDGFLDSESIELNGGTINTKKSWSGGQLIKC